MIITNNKATVLKCQIGVSRNDVVDVALVPWFGYLYYRQAVFILTHENTYASEDFNCVFFISQDGGKIRDCTAYILDGVQINDDRYNDRRG